MVRNITGLGPWLDSERLVLEVGASLRHHPEQTSQEVCFSLAQVWPCRSPERGSRREDGRGRQGTPQSLGQTAVPACRDCVSPAPGCLPLLGRQGSLPTSTPLLLLEGNLPGFTWGRKRTVSEETEKTVSSRGWRILHPPGLLEVSQVVSPAHQYLKTVPNLLCLWVTPPGADPCPYFPSRWAKKFWPGGCSPWRPPSSFSILSSQVGHEAGQDPLTRIQERESDGVPSPGDPSPSPRRPLLKRGNVCSLLKPLQLGRFPKLSVKLHPPRKIPETAGWEETREDTGQEPGWKRQCRMQKKGL